MKQGKTKAIEQAIVAEFGAKRKALGYSYEKLAELTGLHRTSISLVERGKIHPTLAVCLKIAEALELKLENLIKENR